MLEITETNPETSDDIIPHDGQTAPIAAPLCEVLHFVEASNGTRLAKNLKNNTPYPNIADVTSFERTITSIEQLFECLKEHAENGNALLTGSLSKRLENESRAGKTVNTPTRLLIFDIDSNELPFGSREELIDTLTGGPTQFIFQASASAEHAGSLRGHYFMLLDKPMTRAEIKRWLKSLNFESLRNYVKLSKSQVALKWPLDIIVNDAGRIVFIAPPVCDHDPIAQRIILHGHGEDFVEVPDVIDNVDVQAEVARLRDDAKLPARNIDPEAIIDASPDEIKITGVKEKDKFVYLNVNGGDSFGYYFPIDSPDIVSNFKGEPRWRLKDVDPELYSRYAVAKPSDPAVLLQHEGKVFTSVEEFAKAKGPIHNVLKNILQIPKESQAERIKEAAEVYGEDAAAVGEIIESLSEIQAPKPVSAEALGLAEFIAQRFSKISPKVDIKHIRGAVHPKVIQDVIEGTFWDETRSKFCMLKPLERGESLVRCTESEFGSFAGRAFGKMIDSEAMFKLIGPAQPKPEESEKALKRALGAVVSHIKYHNQHGQIRQLVDPFIKTGFISADHARLTVTFSHVPYAEGVIDEAVVADYKQHFAELDDVLSMLAHSRFASDRKKSYLWIKADTDWGKGVFMSALEDLGASVNLTVKECERLLSGDPSGLTPDVFLRATVLIFDEFKTVKSEIKSLQNWIPVTAKRQLTSTVPVYGKLFFSAENVNSLVGDSGVEDQFCQRFSKITKKGSIEARPLFMEDKGAYRRSLSAYIAKFLNTKYAELIALGRDEADRVSTQFLADFHARYGIANSHEQLGNTIAQIANELCARVVNGILNDSWMTLHESKKPKDQRVGPGGTGLHNGSILLRSPAKVFERWVEEHIEFSQQTTIMRKRSDVIAMLSVGDEETGRNYRDKISGGNPRGILLKPLHDRYEEAVNRLGELVEKSEQ